MESTLISRLSFSRDGQCRSTFTPAQADLRQHSKDGLLGGPLGGVGKADVQVAGLLETTATSISTQVNPARAQTSADQSKT